jgi:ribonuclease HI
VWAKQVWFASPLNLRFNQLTSTDFVEWLKVTLPQMHQEGSELISSLCYHIWKARNLLIFQQKDIPVIDIIEQAASSIREYQQHQEKGSDTKSSNVTPCSHESNWSPPPATTLKTNVDAHFHGDGRWGLGWVVRKTDGSCLGAATRIIRARSAIEAEARGLEAVVNEVDRFNGQDIIVEMDARIVVEAIKKKRFPRVYWGKIAKKCSMILDKYPNVSISWIRRSGNTVAHNLAKWAAIEPNKNWLTIVPPQIALHIQKDMRIG